MIKPKCLIYLNYYGVTSSVCLKSSMSREKQSKTHIDPDDPYTHESDKITRIQT